MQQISKNPYRLLPVGEPVPIEDMARVSVGALVVCVEAGYRCKVGQMGEIVDPRIMPDTMGRPIIQVFSEDSWWPIRKANYWQQIAHWRLTYDPMSLASILRFAFDVYALKHADLVRLRDRIRWAYGGYRPAKDEENPLTVADFGLAMLGELAAGTRVKRILTIGRGRLIKAAGEITLTPDPSPGGRGETSSGEEGQ